MASMPVGVGAVARAAEIGLRARIGAHLTSCDQVAAGNRALQAARANPNLTISTRTDSSLWSSEVVVAFERTGIAARVSTERQAGRALPPALTATLFPSLLALQCAARGPNLNLGYEVSSLLQISKGRALKMQATNRHLSLTDAPCIVLNSRATAKLLASHRRSTLRLCHHPRLSTLTTRRCPPCHVRATALPLPTTSLRATKGFGSSRRRRSKRKANSTVNGTSSTGLRAVPRGRHTRAPMVQMILQG